MIGCRFIGISFFATTAESKLGAFQTVLDLGTRQRYNYDAVLTGLWARYACCLIPRRRANTINPPKPNVRTK